MKFQKVYRDANHIEIVTKLRKDQYSVIDLAAVGSSVPDILVGSGNTAVLIEIKMPEGKIYLDQLIFGGRWPGWFGFATTYEDALNLIRYPQVHALDAHAKVVMLGIAREWKEKSKAGANKTKPQIGVSVFKKAMEARLGYEIRI